MPTASRRVVWTLYFVVFVDIFQLTFVFPLLPKIVEALSPEESSGFLGTAAEKIGLLAGVAAAAEGLAAPYLGRLADRVGRRPVFVVAQAGGIASSVVVGLSQSYWVLIFGRCVGGICGGTAGIAAAYIADVTTQEERPGYMTYYMASIFLGLSAGPVIGGYLSVLGGWRVACLAAAVICALNLLCTVLLLPDSQGQRNTSEGDAGEGTASQRCCGRCCSRKSLPCSAWLICTSNFMACVGWTAFEALGVLYVQDSFFPTEDDGQTLATTFYSQMLSCVGVVGLVTNIFLYTRVERRLGLKGSIAVGGVLKAVGYWGIAMPSLGKWAMFAACQVVVFGDQLQSTSIQTLITCVVKPTRFGEAMGQMTLFGNVARTIGPFAFSPIYEHGGKTVPWIVNIFASLVAIVLCILARPSAEQEGARGPEEPSPEGDISGDLVRHLSEQTAHAMLQGQANFAKNIGTHEMPSLRRTRSLPTHGSRRTCDLREVPGPLLRSQTGG